MLPMVVWWYGCTLKATAYRSSITRPYGRFSTRKRRSSLTTSRSDWKLASSTLRLPIRSASSQITRSRKLLGKVSQRSEEHTSELQSRLHLVCRLLLEKKKKHIDQSHYDRDRLLRPSH